MIHRHPKALPDDFFCTLTFDKRKPRISRMAYRRPKVINMSLSRDSKRNKSVDLKYMYSDRSRMQSYTTFSTFYPQILLLKILLLFIKCLMYRNAVDKLLVFKTVEAKYKNSYLPLFLAVLSQLVLSLKNDSSYFTKPQQLHKFKYVNFLNTNNK